jgi:hypothetical protein
MNTRACALTATKCICCGKNLIRSGLADALFSKLYEGTPTGIESYNSDVVFCTQSGCKDKVLAAIKNMYKVHECDYHCVICGCSIESNWRGTSWHTGMCNIRGSRLYKQIIVSDAYFCSCPEHTQEVFDWLRAEFPKYLSGHKRNPTKMQFIGGARA